MMSLQVAEKYVHLVTAINNADTLVTLIVPSIMIIFSNVRISVALSQYYRDRQVIVCRCKTRRSAIAQEAPRPDARLGSSPRLTHVARS